MLLLALDTAGSGCSVCLWEEGQSLAQKTETMSRGQDARLIPMIEEVLALGKKTYDALDQIAVMRGPGSFTGLRLGLAAARAIGFAAHKPVVGLDRFQLYAAALALKPELAAGPCLVLLESRRAELYGRFWPEGLGQQAASTTLFGEAELAACEEACVGQRLTVMGDAKDGHEALLPGALLEPLSVAEVVLLAEEGAKASCEDPAYAPRPLYLRAPDVTLSKAVSS